MPCANISYSFRFHHLKVNGSDSVFFQSVIAFSRTAWNLRGLEPVARSLLGAANPSVNIYRLYETMVFSYIKCRRKSDGEMQAKDVNHQPPPPQGLIPIEVIVVTEVRDPG